MMGGESIKCSDPFADDANTNTPSSRMGGPQVPHSYSGANTSYPGYGSSTNTPSYSMNQQSSLPNMMDRFGDGPPPNRVSTQAEQPNEVYRHNQEGFQGNQFGSHGNMNQMSGQHRYDSFQLKHKSNFDCSNYILMKLSRSEIQLLFSCSFLTSSINFHLYF